VVLAAGLTGWWVGITLGFTIVAVIVVLVAMILTYAARISDQAQDGIKLMDEARTNTLPVWRIQEINASTTNIWRSAEKARDLLEGDANRAYNPR
jgi:uncharacterized protein (UPF0333 family)